MSFITVGRGYLYPQVKRKVIKSSPYSLSSFWFLWFLVFAKHLTVTPGLAPSGFLPKQLQIPLTLKSDYFNTLVIQI